MLGPERVDAFPCEGDFPGEREPFHLDVDPCAAFGFLPDLVPDVGDGLLDGPEPVGEFAVGVAHPLQGVASSELDGVGDVDDLGDPLDLGDVEDGPVRT